MTKKRSLKDVASAPLVGKDEIRMLSRDTALQDSPEKVSVARKAPRQKQVNRAMNSPLQPSEATSASVAKRGACGSFARIAVLILIGLVGGFFFGRFIKII